MKMHWTRYVLEILLDLNPSSFLEDQLSNGNVLTSNVVLEELRSSGGLLRVRRPVVFCKTPRKCNVLLWRWSTTIGSEEIVYLHLFKTCGELEQVPRCLGFTQLLSNVQAEPITLRSLEILLWRWVRARVCNLRNFPARVHIGGFQTATVTWKVRF